MPKFVLKLAMMMMLSRAMLTQVPPALRIVSSSLPLLHSSSPPPSSPPPVLPSSPSPVLPPSPPPPTRERPPPHHVTYAWGAHLFRFVSVRVFPGLCVCSLHADVDNKYQMMTISSPGGHAEVMRFDADSEDEAAEEDLIPVCYASMLAHVH